MKRLWKLTGAGAIAAALVGCTLSSPHFQGVRPTRAEHRALQECIDTQVAQHLTQEPERPDPEIASSAVEQCFGPVEHKLILSPGGATEAREFENHLRTETLVAIRSERARRLSPPAGPDVK